MNIAIIPAAGKGVRFRELGAHYPKCLLPFEGQSLIVKTIKQLQPLMDVIYIVVLDDSHQLWDMIRRMDKVQMVLVDQNLPQGPATSIYCGLKHAAENYPHVMAQDVMPLEGTSVTVVLSDAHYNLDFGSIIRRGYSLVTCMSVKDWSRWCMARVDEEAGGLFLYDKPVDRVPAARALSGVYHFDDGTGAYESFRRAVTLRGSGDADEPQISTALLAYQCDFERLYLEDHVREAFTDFGTLEDFLINRRVSNCRAFNQVYVRKDVVSKGSYNDKDKIFAEAVWMKHGPFSHRCPNIIEINAKEGMMIMERLKGHNLRDLFLYYDRSVETWTAIFNEIWVVINYCKQNTQVIERGKGDFWSWVVEKTQKRCQLTIGEEAGNNAMKLAAHISRHAPEEETLFHGDLHPANMFWDKDSNVPLKFVDPNGRIYGHWLYDVAKLYHSFVRMYDFIDSELYTVDVLRGTATYYDSGVEPIRGLFHEIILSTLSDWELDFVQTICATLFYSMIPLHPHNKTNQMLFKAEGNLLFNMLAKKGELANATI